MGRGERTFILFFKVIKYLLHFIIMNIQLTSLHKSVYSFVFFCLFSFRYLFFSPFFFYFFFFLCLHFWLSPKVAFPQVDLLVRRIRTHLKLFVHIAKLFFTEVSRKCHFIIPWSVQCLEKTLFIYLTVKMVCDCFNVYFLDYQQGYTHIFWCYQPFVVPLL